MKPQLRGDIRSKTRYRPTGSRCVKRLECWVCRGCGFSKWSAMVNFTVSGLVIGGSFRVKRSSVRSGFLVLVAAHTRLPGVGTLLTSRNEVPARVPWRLGSNRRGRLRLRHLVPVVLCGHRCLSRDQLAQQCPIGGPPRCGPAGATAGRHRSGCSRSLRRGVVAARRSTQLLGVHRWTLRVIAVRAGAEPELEQTGDGPAAARCGHRIVNHRHRHVSRGRCPGCDRSRCIRWHSAAIRVVHPCLCRSGRCLRVVGYRMIPTRAGGQ